MCGLQYPKEDAVSLFWHIIDLNNHKHDGKEESLPYFHINLSTHSVNTGTMNTLAIALPTLPHQLGAMIHASGNCP